MLPKRAAERKSISRRRRGAAFNVKGRKHKGHRMDIIGGASDRSVRHYFWPGVTECGWFSVLVEFCSSCSPASGATWPVSSCSVALRSCHSNSWRTLTGVFLLKAVPVIIVILLPVLPPHTLRYLTQSPSSLCSRCLTFSTIRNSINSGPFYWASSPVSNRALSAFSKETATPHPSGSSEPWCGGQSSRTTFAGASSLGKGSFPHTL